MITIKIADIPIKINNLHPMIEEVSKDYITDDEPIFTVNSTEQDIINERKVAKDSDLMSDGFVERLSIYRHISEELPAYDAFLMHGSVIECGDKAYIFTANSGVGKTTHTRLWLSEFKDEVSILNGDKPIIRIFDGVPYACGTPWQGKENYGKNSIKPIGGIAFIARGEKNTAAPISPEDAVMRFMSQIYIPKRSPIQLAKTLRLANTLLKSVKLIELHCNMDPEAAHVCRKALIEE